MSDVSSCYCGARYLYQDHFDRHVEVIEYPRPDPPRRPDPPNAFTTILRTADASGWCWCHPQFYQRALRELAGPLGGPLIDALCTFDPRDILSFSEWPRALELALREVPPPGSDVVLDAWLGRVGQVVRFDDLVLFYIVRHLRHDSEIRRRWAEALVPVATGRHDFSLVESLILTLRGDAVRYPSLVRAARVMAEGSEQMRRVLRNSALLTDPS